MQPDIFYKNDLSVTQKLELLEEAKSKSYNWWVDILDCSKSFSRQKVEMDFEEILSKLTDKSHFTFIHRMPRFNEDSYLETGFVTMVGEPEYFLWIQCKIDIMPQLISKYNLNLL